MDEVHQIHAQRLWVNDPNTPDPLTKCPNGQVAYFINS